MSKIFKPCGRCSYYHDEKYDCKECDYTVTQEYLKMRVSAMLEYQKLYTNQNKILLESIDLLEESRKQVSGGVGKDIDKFLKEVKGLKNDK